MDILDLYQNSTAMQRQLRKTRMHPSRMRTVRCSDCRGGGCTCPGVSAPVHAGIHPPPLWTEFLTHSCQKTLPFRNFVLRTVKKVQFFFKAKPKVPQFRPSQSQDDVIMKKWFRQKKIFQGEKTQLFWTPEFDFFRIPLDAGYLEDRVYNLDFAVELIFLDHYFSV